MHLGKLRNRLSNPEGAIKMELTEIQAERWYAERMSWTKKSCAMTGIKTDEYKRLRGL